MSELEKKFESLGGFEGVKSSLLLSDSYRYVTDHVKRLDKHTHSAIGVIATVNKSLPFSVFSGICHGITRSHSHGRCTDHVVIFSFPFTGKNTADKRFLNSFYTWLTTESLVKDVFYEPWNGEFLCINPFKPIANCLLAMILSRIAKEKYQIFTFWKTLVKSGIGWHRSTIALYSLNSGLEPTAGNGAHCAYPVTFINKECFKKLLKEELFVLNKDEVRQSLPFNNEISLLGGNFALVNNGIRISSYRKSDFYDENIYNPLFIALGYSRRKEYGNAFYTEPDDPLPVVKRRKIVLNFFKDLFESIENEDA